ncbi:hypothetical protein IM792_02950 [Mucilaginibacter sp. JRF]|uniref:hypothetical protein n=1 Tax=Mucilaginibacter sp. JRF TaxID=2780088 RepID=UPI001881CB58|nr:hypothetical protein [Mucilaginibacter sp. JRF]MBE9583394.1 hypothetical protein [Mucilaginibacter sp. JRF]
MKKLFLITIAMAFLVSCHTTKFTMGMQVNEVTRLNPNADLVAAQAGGNYIHRCNTHNNRINKSMFYYFVNNELTQVDEGQRAPDIIIQNK